MKILNKMPFIIFVLISLTVVFDDFITIEIRQSFYSISLATKSLIIFMLPFIIYCLLFCASVSLADGATRIIALILVLVCCSNFISTFLGYFVSQAVFQTKMSLISPSQEVELEPYWTLNLPIITSNFNAMLSGILTGIIGTKISKNTAQIICNKMNHYISYILSGIVYVIPLFILGFIMKLQYDGTIYAILKEYIMIFSIIAIAQFSYIKFLYLASSRMNFAIFSQYLSNMIPAFISAFSTMSSAASMPLTIMGVEKNATDKNLAKSVVPATVNIHLIGDCFAIPILAFGMMKSYGIIPPTLFEYFVFTLYFMMAKFSVAAIPGGGIIVMLPIIEKQLGFNSEMLSIITALYILFDPVITSANVLGNGAFAKIVEIANEKINKFFKKESPIVDSQ